MTITGGIASLLTFISISEIQERSSIPGKARALDARLALYSGEFDSIRGPSGRAFDYRRNVG